ncbi:MAG: XRE family transcriptional regulator [Rhodospirillaceae bacterium]
MSTKKGRIGSSFSDFLSEEGKLEETQVIAIKSVLAYKLEEAMKAQNLSKASMAKRMDTSRSQLDRLLDPDNDSVTLDTLKRAASAVGMRLELELHPAIIMQKPQCEDRDSSQSYEPPEGWGEDALTNYLEEAYRNRHATFANLHEWRDKLVNIDKCFVTIADGWTNPKNPLVSTLFFRAHSAYRAACENAYAGQVANLYPQLRVCMEYAGYALHIDRDDKRAVTWLNRHEDEDSLKAVKQEFQISKVRDTIKFADHKKAEIFDHLYQRCIDWGAHPNEMAVTGNARLIKQGDRKLYEQTYLHGAGVMMEGGLKTTAQCGLCTLGIFQEAFPARFELLGVKHDILELRKNL